MAGVPVDEEGDVVAHEVVVGVEVCRWFLFIRSTTFLSYLPVF